MISKTLRKAKKFVERRGFHKSYSQAGEDAIMNFIFSTKNIRKPTFMDIGAHHPWFLSNTAMFYKKGSRGLNIEPDPFLHKKFTMFRPSDVNLNVGIANEPGELDFYLMSSPVLNTFSKEEAEKYVEESGYEIKDVKRLKVITFEQALKNHFNNVCPDFISLDVEGLDFTILQSIDFEQYRPKVFCVETISYSETGDGVKDEQIPAFLKEKGYFQFADTYINSIFVLEDFWRST